MSQTFTGGPGSHTFMGGPGTNTLDYSTAPAATDVNLAIDTATNGFGGTDTVGNIQVVLGSGHGGTFTAGSGSETFVVTGGNNVISGTPATITEFPVLPTAHAEPFIIKVGPDGVLWFSEFNTNSIDRMALDGTFLDRFPTPASPAGAPNAPSNTGGFAFDAQGNVWFVEVGSDKIGVMSPSGVLLHEYPLPIPTTDPPTFALTHKITLGPDGNMWFAEIGTDIIGRITPDGTITDFPLATASTRGPSTDFAAGSQPFDIIVGPDGALWFSEFTGDKIGRITTDGQITEFNVPRNTSTVPGFPHLGDPVSMVFGPDGAIWYADLDGNAIGRMTTDGQVTEYLLPTDQCQPQDITVGPDGAFWFTEQNSGKIGRITLDGQITEYTIPSPGGSGPFDFGITVGPDGHLYFTEILGNRIGRITTGSALTVDYSNAPNPVTVDLATGTAQNGFGGTDTLTDVQAVIGSAGDDTFMSGGPQTAIGDSVALTGGGGADHFVFTADVLPQGQSELFNEVTDYAFVQGDQIDISGIVTGAFAHGSGQSAASLVRLVEDANNTFARLQVDLDGAANGANFVTIARLDGLHLGDPINVVLDSAQSAGVAIAVTGPTSSNDLNGDGTSDILWHNADGQVTISLLANAIFQSTDALFPVTSEWHITGVNDFNGDGTSDILWHDDSGDNFVELLSNGRFLSGAQLSSTTSDWHVVGTGDFNGDGTADIVWHNDGGANFVELLNDGHFQTGVQIPGTTGDWHVAGIGDFNGDHTSDILWHSDGGLNFIELFENGRFQSGLQIGTTTTDWHVTAVGDFNGDGTGDILWHNDAGQDFVELLHDGRFLFGAQLPDTSSEWHVADTGDYNGDGTSDILWRDDSGQNLIELLKDGQFQSDMALSAVAIDSHVVGHLGELV